MTKTVALLDYGSGNVRSAQRALTRCGAEVIVSNDPTICLNADGLVIPGVGAFAACMKGLKQVYGPRIIDQRLAGGRPVLGICVGMQVLFEEGVEHGVKEAGCGQWPGVVERLEAEILPHMGWNTVTAPADSLLFRGLSESERYYFVHSYGVRSWDLVTDGRTAAPVVTWAQHEKDKFIAAVENGALWATQFHPEKSGDASACLLRNWISIL